MLYSRNLLLATTAQSLFLLMKHLVASARSIQVISPLLPSKNTQKWPNTLNVHHKATCREHHCYTERTTHGQSPMPWRVLKDKIKYKILLTAKAPRLVVVEEVAKLNETGLQRLGYRVISGDKPEKLRQDCPVSWIGLYCAVIKRWLMSSYD